MIEKVTTLTKRTRVIVLLEGKLCKQRNSSFCLTCDLEFSFSRKVLFPRLQNKRERERLFVQSRECDEKVVSFASPPYFIKCACILHGSTVKPQYNEPLYNEVLRMTNDFLYPSNSKIDEKEPRHNETSL